MENPVALVKPKLTAAEKKIIAMVIDGLPSENSRRAYSRHLQEFFLWHALENRPELNKALINRYVKSLRGRKLSSSTINQKLSAIRKLATEAEDNNLIDSRIANGVRSVKGVPFRGRRTGNWLTKEEAQKWLNAPDTKTLKGGRDRALLAVLIGCGLRRAEAAILSFSHIEQREGRWAIVDIVGKRDKMRTVPMPSWAKACLDSWKTVAHLEEGFVFRRVNKGDNLMGESITPQAIRDIVAGYSLKLENQEIAPHDLRRTFAKLAHKGGSPIDQIQLSLGHDSIQTTEKYLGVEQDLTDAPCDHLGLRIGS
ncbi:MAG: tyrosine-type recombinase/integrase [Acidobacteria bacterium]|jgi:site-specific recombinase XerD|nr:tyrosine-type recombinase/integrase [Acidobacteriota bacterium]